MTKLTRSALGLFAAALVFATGAGPASAEPGRKLYTLEFHYDAAKPAAANYDAFRRLAQRECVTPGVRPLSVVRQQRECVAEIMDRFVTQAGRPEIAALHAERTGRRPAEVRDFADRG